MFLHPNIAKSFIAFDDEEQEDGQIYLLMQIGDLGPVALI
jgi:hypothetical protein